MINNIELFYNDKNEYVGFAGSIKVKNKDIYIDTRSGKGYDQVLNLLNDLVGYLASKFNFEGFTNDDNKQHILLRMIEGIPKFNPNKDVKLSTFLQTRVSRLLINEVRDANRFIRNATTLNIKTYSYKCSCGNVIKANSSDNIESCNTCFLPIDKKKRHWIRKSTVSLSELSDGYLSSYYQEPDANKKLAELDLMSCLKNENEETKKIVGLMYFQGYTVNAIAEQLKLSPVNVYNKLKRLRKNQKLNELMRGSNDVCFS